MEKTAVQLLRQKLLNDQQNLPIYIQYINDVVYYIDNQLLEMEKQQIIDAVNSQRQLGWDEKAEQYYNQRFKNK